ncbi:MAG: hypothetical protein ACPG3Z_03945 [Saprospiraceae bacterium]
MISVIMNISILKSSVVSAIPKEVRMTELLEFLLVNFVKLP